MPPNLDELAPVIGKLPAAASNAAADAAPADLDTQAPIIGRVPTAAGAGTPLISAPFITPPAPIDPHAIRARAEAAASVPGVPALAKAPGFGTALWREIKSIPGGMVQGVGDTLAAAGGAAQTEMGQPVTVPNPEQSAQILEGYTGPLPNEGRYGRAAGEMIGNPASYVGPAGLPLKVAEAAGAGVMSELGGELGGTPGSIAGGLVGPGITGHLARAVAPAALGAARALRTAPEEIAGADAAAANAAAQEHLALPAAPRAWDAMNSDGAVLGRYDTEGAAKAASPIGQARQMPPEPAAAGAGGPPGTPPPPSGGAGGAGVPPTPPPGGEAGAALVRGLSPEARASLKDAVDRQGITADNLADKTADLHPAQMLGEVGPSLTADMGALASVPGGAKNAITAELGARTAATPARLDALLTDTFGEQRPPGAIVRQLKQGQAQASDPLYKAWNDTIVPPTPALAALTPRLEAAGAVREAQKKLAIEGVPSTISFAPSKPGGKLLKTNPNNLSSADLGLPGSDLTTAQQSGPTARAYDFMKQALDAKISAALRNEEPGSARLYGKLKDELIAAIDNHPDPRVAGVWKNGREAFQAPAQVIDAIKTGTNFFDPRLSLDELESKFAGATGHQMEGLRTGLRAAAGHFLEGSVRGDANLRNKVSSLEARRKIAWAVGKDAADRFEAAIEAESKIAKSPTAIIGGSPTQPRQEAAKNWTVQPSRFSETIGQLLEEKAGGPLVGFAAHMAGLEPVSAIALGASAHVIQKVRNAAAEKAMAGIRDQVAPVMTLKGADAKGALHELLHGAPPEGGAGATAGGAAPRPSAGGATVAPPSATPAPAAAAKAPAPESLQALLDRGAPKSELVKHPDFVAAADRARSFPETTTLPGYGTPEFQASRQFDFGGEKVTGYAGAVERLTQKAESYAGGAVGRDKEATIVIGPSAAGKSKLSEEIAHARHAAIADPDDAKVTLPEYRGGIGAAAVHEESSQLGAQVLKNLVRDGKNLVVPRVGGSADSIRAYRDALAEHGYKVNLVNLTVKSDEVYRRMIGRFLKTGRIVGSDYMEKVGDKPKETYAKLKGEGGFAETANFDGNTREMRMIDGGATSFGDMFGRQREAPAKAAAPAGAMLGPSVPNMPPHKVTAADNTSIDVAPVVMEAHAVKTSADAGYDPGLQPRQRDRAASQAQIREIAGTLDPERLGYSAEADRGAPIVGPDGVVESGNGRIMALRQVYAQNGPQAGAYRDWLAQQGVDPTKFKAPVLVRQRTSELSPQARQQFTVAANQAATLAMSGPERALADARRLSPDTLDLIRDPADLGGAGNRDFARAFMAGLPASERGALMNAQGGISQEGLGRMRNAVLAKAYGDSHILGRIAESTDDEVKSISNALTQAAPAWAKLRAGIDAGEIDAAIDVTPALVEAVGKTADLRGRGQKLDSFLAQSDAFSKLDNQVEAFMRIFYDPKGRRAAGAQTIARALQLYAQEGAKVSAAPGLNLGLAPVKPGDIMKTVAARGNDNEATPQPGLFNAGGAGHR